MALSEQHAAYSDCFDKLDRALADPAGIRVLFPDQKQAKLFQLRCCKARVLDRRQNERVYPKSHKMHGNSPYDVLMVRNPKPTAEEDGKFWVYLEPQEQEVLEIESLGDDDETTTADGSSDASAES